MDSNYNQPNDLLFKFGSKKKVSKCFKYLV